jgi:hypothetical protein
VWLAVTGKPETLLQTAIVRALRQMGVWVIVMNVTRRRGKRGVNCGEPGMPDLWTEYGWLEVKLPGGELDPDQVAWHERAASRGVLARKVDSVSKALIICQQWRGMCSLRELNGLPREYQ